jgi:hypothetical protein
VKTPGENKGRYYDDDPPVTKYVYHVRGTADDGEELPPFSFPTREIAEKFHTKAEAIGPKMGWTVHPIEEVEIIDRTEE